MVKIKEEEKRWDIKDSDQGLPFVQFFVWGGQSIMMTHPTKI